MLYAWAACPGELRLLQYPPRGPCRLRILLKSLKPLHVVRHTRSNHNYHRGGLRFLYRLPLIGTLTTLFDVSAAAAAAAATAAAAVATTPRFHFCTLLTATNNPNIADNG